MHETELFESEVMAVIEEEKLLKGEAETLEDDNNAKFRSDFMAAYLLRRPHEQSPWNANMSSMLNTILDDILTLDGLPLDAPVRRSHLLRLSQAVRQQFDHYYVIPCLFPEDGILKDLPYDYLLLRAQIITGHPVLQCDSSRRLVDFNVKTPPYHLGTLVNSAIWGRQYDLARYVLSKSKDICGGANLSAGATVHQALPAAIINGDRRAVEMLLEAPWKYPTSGPSFDAALELSIRLGHAEITSILEVEGDREK
jgi:hypothetical protein